MCNKCDETHDGAQPELAGIQFGVEFNNKPYDNNRHNWQFRVLSEDDEYWHHTNLSASIMWLPDLIEQLQRALDIAKRKGWVK